MNGHRTLVDHYLNEFRAGSRDEAFHGLIEADSIIVSDLINACGETKDLDEKVFLIEVVSEFRLDSSLEFLREALYQNDARIWKAALDGMVMIESDDAMVGMDQVLSSVEDSMKRDWIEEAVADIRAAIHQNRNQRVERDD